MANLTVEHLNPMRYYHYDYGAYTRGKTYYNQGRVDLSSFDGETAVCLVNGNQGLYTVILAARTRTQLDFSCDCPQAERAYICKHIMASMMYMQNYLLYEAPKRWQYQLLQAIDAAPKAQASKKQPVRHIILFGLESSYYGYGQQYVLTPYQIKLHDLAGILYLPELPERGELRSLLDANRRWTGSAVAVTSAIKEGAVANMPPEAAQILNLMIQSGYPFYGLSNAGQFMSLWAKLDVPVFRMSSKGNFKELLSWHPEPVMLEAGLMRDGQDLKLSVCLRVAGQLYTNAAKDIKVITYHPTWVLAGTTMAPVGNPDAMSMMQYLPVTVPAENEVEFFENYLPLLIQRIPVQSDVITWEDVEADPVPRLYLSDSEGRLQASLRFGYAAHEVNADPKAASPVIKPVPGSWALVRVHRNLEQEQAYYQLLTGARFGLKRGQPSQPPGTFELRARTHVLDFLTKSIPLLLQQGFEIYGEENLKAGRINRSAPKISLHISSGIDWFDVEALVTYGDQQVSLGEIRRALQKQQRYIRLADGTIGQIPEEWLARYKKLFDLAEETPTGLRVRDVHLPLVDTLLADADASSIAREFRERRERLANFDGIASHPLPQGFTGDLRPYQKAGLDWLHFLHEYGFGGCLADDMGLGKTIQALAFLQSLVEEGKAGLPSLLVVPKSLLANWQREAERFTPGMRLLEYYGQGRVKDPSMFADADLVLTTYGTLLRDIKFLRTCRFHYAILDESQAIKNPASQTSKAARLIQSDHRLVMTGTPVENNTFELWSQFAFLNPGLLGSLDYFKREFASPVESKKDEQTAGLLRRLVYPFILRRTKLQVAPELPLRTERIIYTDLEPAQRKLYNQAREHYRRKLLGQIESEGLNEARMAVLEGLLRLRQICIHPALVDPDYRGEAAKLDLLLETLDTLSREGHKALVFSQFVQALKILRKELDQRRIPYAYLDGQTSDRQAAVDSFQEDPHIPFFLISLKAGGVGLNLTAADYVIHIDPWWNPAVEMQAADRAHRIGQDKPVFIYKIIARNSVEEKILKLQEHKRELVDQIISTEGGLFKSLTAEDVKVLFS